VTAPRLTIVTVNWNGGDEAVQNAGAVAALALRRGDVELVLIDNASTDGSVEKLASMAAGTSVRLVRQSVNLGFGPASNAGAALARAPLLLFLNPDARPREGDDPLEPLLTAAAREGRHAGFCPLLEDAEAPGRREAQESFQFRRLVTPASLAREMLLFDRILWGGGFRREGRYLDQDRSVPFDVEQPAAAALAIRREVFLRLGGFDERFTPAWWEDVDLAARFAGAGERFVTVPGSRFVHRGGSSIAAEGRLVEREYRRIYGRNLLRYAEKWWGEGSLPWVRALLASGGAIRLALAASGFRGDRARKVTLEAARGTFESAFLSIDGEAR